VGAVVGECGTVDADDVGAAVDRCPNAIGCAVPGFDVALDAGAPAVPVVFAVAGGAATGEQQGGDRHGRRGRRHPSHHPMTVAGATARGLVRPERAAGERCQRDDETPVRLAGPGLHGVRRRRELDHAT
jgi:hypothetical protein